MQGVSCQNGPTRHACAWQIGPFWQDTLAIQGECHEGRCSHAVSMVTYVWERCKCRAFFLCVWLLAHRNNKGFNQKHLRRHRWIMHTSLRSTLNAQKLWEGITAWDRWCNNPLNKTMLIKFHGATTAIFGSIIWMVHNNRNYNSDDDDTNRQTTK